MERVPLVGSFAPARGLAFGLDPTVYDAARVALSERLVCPLATADDWRAQ